MAEILGASMAVLAPGLDPDCIDVITIQRDDYPHIPYPGRWEVPGGTVDPGENAPECGIREIYEEVGVVVPPEAIVWMGLYRSKVKKNAFNAYFVAQLHHQPELRLGDEGRAAKYMRLGDFLSSGEVILDHSDRLWDYMIRLQGATYPNGDIHSDPFRLPTGLSTDEYREIRWLALQKKLGADEQILA
jgi:8-oxo-dGTP diphosphatase